MRKSVMADLWAVIDDKGQTCSGYAFGRKPSAIAPLVESTFEKLPVQCRFVRGREWQTFSFRDWD